MRPVLAALFVCVLYLTTASISSAQPEPQPFPDRETAIETAPVVIDGIVLFSVRGMQAYPAKERAKNIEGRIRNIAADRSVNAASITSVDAELSTDLVAGNRHVMMILDADAAQEGVPRQALAKVYVHNIRTAVEKYRADRSMNSVMRGILYMLLATAVVAALLVIVSKLFHRLNAAIESRFGVGLEGLRIRSYEILQAEKIRVLIKGGINAIRLVIVLSVLYFYLLLAFSFFPWTRFISANLFDYAVSPLRTIGEEFLAYIPHLIFIGIIVLVARYFLKFLYLFFMEVESGTPAISGFDRDWARPTYKIVRLLVLVLVAVIIYPYIPGSGSEAFKGISIFLGVLLSLGSSSAVANIVAGYLLLYRRAFKIGDRVQIGNYRGDVTELRLQVVHLRTIKNEEVTIPNSVIINSEVVNYSTFSRDRGLILHTTVTISYDAPWRQVHALLLMAAERTGGLLHEPPPFVLQKSLDDFFVTYELNAYSDTPHMMARLYSELHKNIQDCFNEYGVQIMSPHYESDPESRKLVPQARWHEPPAANKDGT